MYKLITEYLILLLFFAVTLSLSSCNIFGPGDDDLWGDWKEVSSYEGIPRSNAVAFSINGKGYVGTGYNSQEDDDEDRLQDFWQYNPEQNFWVQKADFPGTPRSSAVAFVANGKGYIGTGYNDDINDDYLDDFWSYNPETNRWDSVAAFGGSARYGAVAFSINNKGYVGTGNDDNDLKDFWRYDPELDQWTQIVSLPGDKRIDAVAFVIRGKAYVGTGRNNGLFEEDFFSYDPQTEKWNRLHNLDEDRDEDERDIPRSKAVGFVMNDIGYIALGEKGGNRSDIWKYNPTNDTWTDEDLAYFEGRERRDAVAFTIDSLAYVGTGTRGAWPFDDFWSYNPRIENDEDNY